jgi:hypothetical protein
MHLIDLSFDPEPQAQYGGGRSCITDFIKGYRDPQLFLLQEHYSELCKLQPAKGDLPILQSIIEIPEVLDILKHSCNRILDKFNMKKFQVIENFQAWAYVQDKDKHTNHWHNHSKSASVNFVTYLRPGAAGLQVIDVCPWDGPKVIELEVVEGVMYTMPGWMMHKPATNWSNEARVSINCEFTYDTQIEVNGHKWA